MSTLRVTNIEAKGDPSSPSVDEKLKLTNSTGDVVLEVDGKNVGAGQTVFVGSGIVTATSVNANVSATTVSATTVSVAGSITATNLYGDASSLTGIDATALKSGGVVKVPCTTRAAGKASKHQAIAGLTHHDRRLSTFVVCSFHRVEQFRLC